jgi:photosystem II stability/assembly factor-like uncharacterized protein
MGAAVASAQAAGTWTPLNSGRSGPLVDVQCAQGACYVMADSGAVLRTADGGASWTLRSIHGLAGSSVAPALSFLDSLHGYCAGGGRRSYKTNDGGVSWHEIETAYAWQRVQLLGKDQGYFTAENLEYIGTTGGQHPFPIYAYRILVGTLAQSMDPKPAYLSPVHNTGCIPYFTGARTGFAACTDGRIERTVNAGKTWSGQMVSAGLNGLHFPTSRVGYAVGAAGRIFRTQDSGVTWQAQTSGTLRILRAVRFADAQTGYAVGDSGTILGTSNGGATWNPMTSNTTVRLSAIALSGDGSSGFAVGTQGVLLKLSGGVPGVPASLSVPARALRAPHAGMAFGLPDGRVFNLLGRQDP